MMDSALAISSVIFTAALVIITAFYAWQTRRMVLEMHRARGASVRPNISLSVKHLEGGTAFVILENTGLGPAMAVDVLLTYQPGGSTQSWRTSVMPVGEQARFFIRDLVQTYDEVHLTGSCLDALGDHVEVSGDVVLKEVWDANTQAQLMLEDDPAAKTATELEQIRHGIERLVMALEKPPRTRSEATTSSEPRKTESSSGNSPTLAPISIRRQRGRRGQDGR